jgi:hypothetical protein
MTRSERLVRRPPVCVCACALLSALICACGAGDEPALPAADADAAAAFDRSGSDAVSDSTVGCTGASPSFASQVSPILHGCLGGETCHGYGFAYSSLVNAPSRRDLCPTTRILVSPGSLENSYMMNKLTGVDMCAGSVRMPFGGVLAVDKIQTIADWICAGAQDD